MDLMKSWTGSRNRGRERRKELMCDNECESVSHVLRECPISNLRNGLVHNLQELLVEEFECF